MDDHVVFVAELSQHAGEDLLATDFGDQLHLGGGQVDVRRHDVQILEIRVLYDLVRIDRRVEQRSIHGVLDSVRVDAEADCRGSLRVEVDDQATAPVLAERAGDVDGTGGLAHPAFLVAYGDDARGTVLRQRFRRGERLVFSSKQISRHTVHLIITSVRGAAGRADHHRFRRRPVVSPWRGGVGAADRQRSLPVSRVVAVEAGICRLLHVELPPSHVASMLSRPGNRSAFTARADAR